MTPPELLNRLIGLFPNFATQWNDPDNCFRGGDGSFTSCGVFWEFADFYRVRYESQPPERLAALGMLVADCMASPDPDLGTAAATCFLENIAGEACGRGLAGYLNEEALVYYRAWDGSI